ncbi:polyprenyl synthetase family protein [soil metagenome]
MQPLFESALARSLPVPTDDRDLVGLAMQETVMSRGKRLRPMLLLSAAAALGVDPVTMHDAACALELVHAASLVLDDMPCMDNASLRRGRPTAHLQFGEDVASLAVVALVSQAYRQIAASEALSLSQRCQMLVVLADAVGHRGLVSGQLRDLRPVESGRDATDAARVNQLKTGSLFRAAFDMAALAAGASASARHQLQCCADEIGQAFQLLDDMKDSGDVPSWGKSLHLDDGKRTLLSALGRDAARERMQRHLSVTEALLCDAFGDAGPVLQVLRRAMSTRSATATNASPD